MIKLDGTPTNDQETVRKMCGSKKRYISRDEAYPIAHQLQKTELNQIHIYRCPYCHYIHIGRNKKYLCKGKYYDTHKKNIQSDKS